MKLPADAFNFFLGLGSTRSLQAVAAHFGVSRQAVAKRAQREDWAAMVAKADAEVRDRGRQDVLESMHAVNERHLKTLQVIQRKALETLKAMPLGSAIDAVRALDLAIRQERVVRGEPSDRNAISVEDVIKKEYERWMAVSPEAVDPAPSEPGAA